MNHKKNQSDSATKLNDIQTAIKVHDYDIYKSTGVSSNASGWPKAISDGMSMLSNQIKGPKGELLNKVAPEGSKTREIIDNKGAPKGFTSLKSPSGQWVFVENSKVEEKLKQGYTK